MDRNSQNWLLDRREVLKRLSVLMGTTGVLPFLSTEALLAHGQAIHRHAAQKTADLPAAKPLFFDSAQFETVDLLCELIIPQTSTAGARAAKVPQFIDLLLAEHQTHLQNEIRAGLEWLDRRSEALYQRTFREASTDQQTDLLKRLSSPEAGEDTLGQVFFEGIKRLTIFAYYTSREGLEQEIGYVGPMGTGSYEGSVPLGPS
ncbi:MAG: gluconate 2-dehydrogenase subunit 3 family protein [Acidobacteriota bacterium]